MPDIGKREDLLEKMCWTGQEVKKGKVRLLRASYQEEEAILFGPQRAAVAWPEAGTQPQPASVRLLPRCWNHQAGDTQQVVKLQRKGCLAKAGIMKEQAAKAGISEGVELLPEMPPESGRGRERVRWKRTVCSLLPAGKGLWERCSVSELESTARKQEWSLVLSRAWKGLSVLEEQRANGNRISSTEGSFAVSAKM